MDKALEILRNNLDAEITNFRGSFSRMSYIEVYNSWYKIGFFEEYYEMLMCDYADEHLSDNQAEWLAYAKTPLEYLYNLWLDCDGAMSHDWDDMIEWLGVTLEDIESSRTRSVCNGLF